MVFNPLQVFSPARLKCHKLFGENTQKGFVNKYEGVQIPKHILPKSYITPPKNTSNLRIIKFALT